MKQIKYKFVIKIYVIYFINSVLIASAVLIHYEMLRWMSLLIPRLAVRPRLRVLFGVSGALTAHVTLWYCLLLAGSLWQVWHVNR